MLETSPRDVIRAALTTPIPESDRPQVDLRADFVLAALIAHGHLPDPAQPPPEPTIEDLARYLAEQSRHPRYTVPADDRNPAGWTRLLASDSDVLVAWTAAIKGATQEEIANLNAIKHRLIDHANHA